MCYISCNKYDKSEFNEKVTAIDKLQDTNNVNVNSSLHDHLQQIKAISEQFKETNDGITFVEKNMNYSKK